MILHEYHVLALANASNSSESLQPAEWQQDAHFVTH